MEVIEEASNMLLIKTDSGIIQKPNNPRTRLKYGAGEIKPQTKLFEGRPVEFNSIQVYPTENKQIFLTILSEGGDTLPTVYQNPPALSLEYLSKLESFLLGELSVDEFKKKLYTELTLSAEENSNIHPRLNLMKRWFENVDGIVVSAESIKIGDEIILMWDGVSVKKDSLPTELITEFYPTINFLYNTNLSVKWNSDITFSESEITIINRATRLYDKLITDKVENIESMAVNLPE